MNPRGVLPAQLWAAVGPVWIAGIAVILAAGYGFVTDPRPLGDLAGIGCLLVVSMLAERYPVQIHGVDAGGVSLGFVFAGATVVLFGWEAAVLVTFAAPVIVQILEHRPPVRVTYNASVFALGAALAGALIAPIDGSSPAALLSKVFIAFAAIFLVDWILVNLVIALHSGRSYRSLLKMTLEQMAIPAALMASAALMLVVLWERSPAFTAALFGPLIAIALYQRSQFRELKALRLALTDPLTGLGNHRHFHERLQRELVDAQDEGAPLSLVLVDVDDFKKVNDRFGHPTGDRVLSQVAARLRQGGEAFRLGGDEFAVLLPGLDSVNATSAAQSVLERIEGMDLEQGTITVSAGVATFPSQGVARDELIRLADSALYWAKEHGKNQVRVYRPDVVELAELKRLAAGPDRAARYRAAASLAKAVDARDVYTGSHSERVAELAARIAQLVGADDETIELTRLAASLHDLGKLAIPEEILRKPGPLTEPERLVLQRHPQIGYRMLESLGVDPVAEWVLHHHERWDGTGYPDGLAEEEIALGARIIFVADAFDAMTSDRVYQPRLSAAEALAELERCAGTQFDPGIVGAFAEDLGVRTATAVLAS
ncbi:MAG: diguanylate cyclase [Gaiellaceae bacterium]